MVCHCCSRLIAGPLHHTVNILALAPNLYNSNPQYHSQTRCSPQSRVTNTILLASDSVQPANLELLRDARLGTCFG